MCLDALCMKLINNIMNAEPEPAEISGSKIFDIVTKKYRNQFFLGWKTKQKLQPNELDDGYVSNFKHTFLGFLLPSLRS